MDQTKVKDSTITKISSEEVQKHTNSVSVENVEKLTIRTKNGYVNGVGEGKCKSSKKNAKVNVTHNAAKETKKGKKGQDVDVQNHKVEVSNSSIQRKNKGCHENKYCNFVTASDVNEKLKISPATAMRTDCNTKKNVDTKTSNLNPNQSDSKTNDSSSNKSDVKRKRNKPKLNKTEPNIQREQKFDLPKLDVTPVVNPSENLACHLSEAASCSSQLEASKAHILDYTDDSSEFEKDLLESIKNIKLSESLKNKLQQSNANEASSEINGDNSNKVEPHGEELHTAEVLPNVTYVQYESELQMPMIMKIIQKDLSEPYSIYTYRYFIHNWPKLCFLAMCEDKCVGAIVCKLDFHRKSIKRGYIAMLAVDKDYRKRKIGSTLVRRAITEMIDGGADEVVLETEVTNKSALRLYEQLGFVRDKRLFRYYLNGVDALRLKLWLR